MVFVLQEKRAAEPSVAEPAVLLRLEYLAALTVPLSSAADSTFDSGQGSTVYSDSQSSQRSGVLGSLADAAPPAPCVCSPPVSASTGDGPGLPSSLPAPGPYQQPAVVSCPPLVPEPAPRPPSLPRPP